MLDPIQRLIAEIKKMIPAINKQWGDQDESAKKEGNYDFFYSYSGDMFSGVVINAI